jgi:hypothetical protein
MFPQSTYWNRFKRWSIKLFRVDSVISLRLSSFFWVILIWFDLTCTIHHDVIPCRDVYAAVPLYSSELDPHHVVPPFLFFPFSILRFFSILFSFYLGLVIGANQVFRVGLLLACARSAARCRKPFPSIYPRLCPATLSALVRDKRGSEQVRRNGQKRRTDPKRERETWFHSTSSLRIENKKMKSIVLCQFLRRPEGKKSRSVHSLLANTHTGLY